MPVYQIIYNTKNVYSAPVRDAVLEFLVLPALLPNQRIDKLRFSFEPEASYYTGQNFFGFDFLRFRLKEIKESFSFSMSASVTKEESNPFDFSVLSREEELRILKSDEFLIDNYLYLAESDQTSIPESYLFPQMEKDERVFDFARRINTYIHKEISYDSRIVDPHRLLSETLVEKKGVCQDLAHLMIGIIRKNKIPARYVSGYLNQGEHVLGAGAVHAWVEVLIPEAGWIGFDPTNDLLEDHHYIKIAHGQDIRDCATLKGVLKGTGTNETNYEVLVQEQNIECNQ